MIVLGWTVVIIAFGVAVTVTVLMERDELAPRWLAVCVSILAYVPIATAGFRLIEVSWGAAFANALISLLLAVPAGVGLSWGIGSQSQT